MVSDSDYRRTFGHDPPPASEDVVAARARERERAAVESIMEALAPLDVEARGRVLCAVDCLLPDGTGDW